MEDFDDSSGICFDVVRLDSTHWCVHIAGVPQLVSFTSRDSATAAARARKPGSSTSIAGCRHEYG